MSVEIGKETTKTEQLRHGHTVVGTNRVKLCESFEVRRGVLLRCPGSNDDTENTVTVFVGGSQVTADYDPATGGFPIIPGAAIEIPCSDPSELFLIASADNQDVAWLLI